MKTIEIGRIGEKAATRFLKKNRYKILNKNLHISRNEIDIIAEDKEFVVFVEVKTRSVSSGADAIGFIVPSQAVTKEKQQRTITAARSFLSGYKKARQPRFDVIEIYLNKENQKVIKINHIINAFGA